MVGFSAHNTNIYKVHKLFLTCISPQIMQFYSEYKVLLKAFFFKVEIQSVIAVYEQLES